MGLLNAFKQYVRDAMPGGALNPEVTKQGLLDSAALGTAPVPILGDAVGLLSDLSRFKDNPAERTPTNIGLSALGVLPFVPSFAGMFVGKGSKTWDAVAAAKAQQLADKGVDQRQIWKETGTFKGPDGAWRQEIDDSAAVFEKPFRQPTSREAQDAIEAQDFLRHIADAKKAAQNQHGYTLKGFYDSRPGDYEKYQKASETVRKYNRDFVDPKTSKGVLADFLDHQELYKAYPSTSLTPTTYKQDHSGGVFMENMNEMLIGQGNEKSITLHELQHAIQGREGWARGGRPEDMSTILDSLLAQKKSEARRFGEMAYRNDPLGPTELLKPGARARQLAAEREAQKLRDWIGRIDEFGDGYANKAYQNLAGEAEARATQARMNLNAAQRRELFPLDSYDVPVEQLIIRRGLLD